MRGQKKSLKLMSITSIATDTVKHNNDIGVHTFSLFYQIEFNSLSKNNPYLINTGSLLVFNNPISSGKDNRLTLQQLIKIHSYRFTQERNSLSKYIVIHLLQVQQLIKIQVGLGIITVQQLIKIHSNTFTQECNSLFKNNL